LQIETQAPNAPVLSLDAANDTGLTGDNTTNQSSVTIDVSAETAGEWSSTAPSVAAGPRLAAIAASNSLAARGPRSVSTVARFPVRPAC
jgi:hypothetical protein